jgi:hypothetical protein
MRQPCFEMAELASFGALQPASAQVRQETAYRNMSIDESYVETAALGCLPCAAWPFCSASLLRPRLPSCG